LQRHPRPCAGRITAYSGRTKNNRKNHPKNNRKKTRLTPLHLLAFAVSFAMTGICTALAITGGSNPLTVVTLRTVTATLLVLAWLRFAGVPLAISRGDAGRALIVAVPLALNNYMLNAAFGEIPVPLAVLIFYLWPALTTAASWMTGREPFRWRTAAGLALAFAGVALALNVELTAAQAKGVWLALGASVAWSLSFLLTGHFFRGRDTRAPTLHMSLMVLGFFVVACAITADVRLPGTLPGWTGIVGVGFFYAFALIGLFAATARIGPARSGFYMNFEPVASVLLAALILGQRLAPVQLAGAALVISALFLFRPPGFAPASPSRRS
jgi:drug/metabolite transporter (DMT)-like permease